MTNKTTTTTVAVNTFQSGMKAYRLVCSATESDDFFEIEYRLFQEFIGDTATGRWMYATTETAATGQKTNRAKFVRFAELLKIKRLDGNKLFKATFNVK